MASDIKILVDSNSDRVDLDIDSDDDDECGEIVEAFHCFMALVGAEEEDGGEFDQPPKQVDINRARLKVGGSG